MFMEKMTLYYQDANSSQLNLQIQCNFNHNPAAAAAKLLQLCPTLCDPMMAAHQAPPGILQARTLEWVAISFSNA